MKSIVITLAIILTYTQVFAQKTLECERYKVENNTKIERTIYTLTFLPEKSIVAYEIIEGPDYFLSSKFNFKVLWKSADNMRVVASKINSEYGTDKQVWHPVHIIDIDFGKLNVKTETYGGFSDFSELISSPWKFEYKRID